MNQISMYTTNWCPYCQQAKRLLETEGLTWKEINIELEGISRVQLSKMTGGHTVPQILINGISIGGFTDLHALQQSGKLREMLESPVNAEFRS